MTWETKDYWTICLSIAAIVIAVGSLLVAGASYRLNAARDRREREAKKPLVRTNIPMLDGAGPWVMSVSVANRDDVPIKLLSFHSEGGDPVSLYGYGRFTSVALASFDSGAANWIDLGEDVAPGESSMFEVQLQPMKGRIGADADARFALRYIRGDTAESADYLLIRRKLNPTNTIATP